MSRRSGWDRKHEGGSGSQGASRIQVFDPETLDSQHHNVLTLWQEIHAVTPSFVLCFAHATDVWLKLTLAVAVFLLGCIISRARCMS